MEEWCRAYTVSISPEDVVGQSAAGLHPDVAVGESPKGLAPGDEEKGGAVVAEKKRGEAVYGVDRPLFHIDLTDAVDAAVRNAQTCEALEALRTETEDSVLHSEV